MSRRVVVSSCMLICLALVVCGSAPAQGPDPCVIRPVPTIKYAMASPRSCLIGPPVLLTDAYYVPALGAAENFPRRPGAIRVPVGTRVVFCLSRDLEGVWYSHSFGCLGTSLTLQLCRGCMTPDCDCPRCDPNGTNVRPCRWITIGRDGAKDVRRGPSIGRAKVGVPVRFRRPGIYHLRGIIHTFAKPGFPPPPPEPDGVIDDPGVLPPIVPIPPTEDRDVVHVVVHVVNVPVIPDEPVVEAMYDPDVEHVRPMPKIIDPNGPPEPIADLNGDDVVNFADLAIIAQEWGREYEMPFTDDE